MKKSVLFALAVAGVLASCSNDETLSVADKQVKAIGFSSYVDKTTRAETNLASLEASGIKVWGAVSTASNGYSLEFNGQEVKYTGTDWTYSPQRYWIPDADYAFTALGPIAADVWSYEHGTTADLDKLHGTVTFNQDKSLGNTDLVHAFAARNNKNDNPDDDSYVNVPFTFKHLLSRVRVGFENKFPAEATVLKFTNVSISQPKSATLALEGTDATAALSTLSWTPSTEFLSAPLAYTFGTTPVGTSSVAGNGGMDYTNPLFLIPSVGSVTVKFDVQLVNGSQFGHTFSHEVVVDLTGKEFKPGYSYTLLAKIDASNIDPDGSDLHPINFTVTAVDNWEDYADEIIMEP